MKSKKLTALGGDIFAGLFTRGVMDAGFEVLGHLEHGPYGVATAKANFPDLDVRIGPHAWRPEEYAGKVDFMYTNCPCAAWSSAMMKHKEGWRDHPERLQFVRDLSTAGQLIRPKAWAWESVVNAWRHGREFVIEHAQAWNAQGYQVTILLQDNQYLGVPQARQRMFFIAHRHPLVWPAFTKPVTVAQALKKVREPKKPHLTLPDLQPLHVELWKRCGSMKGRMRDAYNLMSPADRQRLGGQVPLNVYRRMFPDQPAPVMFDGPTRLHPFEPRMLTYAEWLVFCGLPKDWKSAASSYLAATKEMARAVMPPVGRWLATAVKDGLERPAYRGVVRTSVVDLRDPEKPVTELLWSHPMIARPEVTWDPAAPPPKVTRTGAPRTPREPGRPGSGARTRELLATGQYTTNEILEIIHREFPQSKATASDVSWNKRKLRQLRGEL